MLKLNNSRRSERHSMKALISFKKENDFHDRIFSGLTLDIGIRGSCIFSPTTLESGDKLTLWLLHGENSDLIHLTAQVIWVAIDDLYGDSPYWLRAGIQFDQPNDESRKALSHYLPPAPVYNLRSKRRKHLLSVLP